MSRQIAQIHEIGFVWEDPKIDNIVYDYKMGFCCIDFGLSAPIDSDHKYMLRGSPGYTLSIN